MDELNDLLKLLYYPNLKLIICEEFKVEPDREQNEFQIILNISESYVIFNTVYGRRKLDYISTLCEQSYTNGVNVYFSFHKCALDKCSMENFKLLYTCIQDFNKFNI